jgi:hypothetical protein
MNQIETNKFKEMIESLFELSLESGEDWTYEEFLVQQLLETSNKLAISNKDLALEMNRASL